MLYAGERISVVTDERHVGRLIKQINDELQRQIDNEMRPRGITMSQMRVLVELGNSPEGVLATRQIEKALGVAQPTTWGLISRLERKGLVRSAIHPHNARAKLIYLTDEGLTLYLQGYKEMQEHERQLTACLTTEESEQLKDLLERVRTGLSPDKRPSVS